MERKREKEMNSDEEKSEKSVQRGHLTAVKRL